MEFDIDLMIPDMKLSIAEGAIAVLGWQSCTDKKSYTRAILDALCKEYGFDLDTPFQDYDDDIKDILINGTKGHSVKVYYTNHIIPFLYKVYYKGQRGEGIYDVAFEGLLRNVQRKYREVSSETMKAEYETYMTITPCEVCKGQRLKKESLAVTIGDKNIAEIGELSIEKLKTFLEEVELTPRQQLIGQQVLKEINSMM